MAGRSALARPGGAGDVRGPADRAARPGPPARGDRRRRHPPVGAAHSVPEDSGRASPGRSRRLRAAPAGGRRGAGHDGTGRAVPPGGRAADRRAGPAAVRPDRRPAGGHDAVRAGTPRPPAAGQRPPHRHRRLVHRGLRRRPGRLLRAPHRRGRRTARAAPAVRRPCRGPAGGGRRRPARVAALPLAGAAGRRPRPVDRSRGPPPPARAERPGRPHGVRPPPRGDGPSDDGGPAGRRHPQQRRHRGLRGAGPAGHRPGRRTVRHAGRAPAADGARTAHRQHRRHPGDPGRPVRRPDGRGTPAPGPAVGRHRRGAPGRALLPARAGTRARPAARVQSAVPNHAQRKRVGRGRAPDSGRCHVHTGAGRDGCHRL